MRLYVRCVGGRRQKRFLTLDIRDQKREDHDNSKISGLSNWKDKAAIDWIGNRFRGEHKKLSLGFTELEMSVQHTTGNVKCWWRYGATGMCTHSSGSKNRSASRRLFGSINKAEHVHHLSPPKSIPRCVSNSNLYVCSSEDKKRTFRAEFFIITQNWTQPINNRLDQWWYIHMTYYRAMQMSKPLLSSNVDASHIIEYNLHRV